MPVIRAFIAIELPKQIHQHLDQVISQLKNRLVGSPIRWVPAENIHLTLKFLGEVSTTNVEILEKLLRAEAAGCSHFEISVGGLGAFPNTHNPRVIWVGVEAPSDLTGLQRLIEAATERLGYLKEDRPFSAHLTLGRVSRNATPREARLIGEALEATKVGFLGAAHIGMVHLFKSDLCPTGSIYSKIFTAPLRD
jgi:RNA 2',3'-cyclic 3'-phosphodiesterase